MTAVIDAAHQTDSAPGQASGIETLLDGDDARLLVEIGFMSLMRGLPEAAADIFTGVVAARPKGEAGYIGLALARLHAGEADEAAAILRRRPPSDAARLFLAVSLQRLGDLGEARTILADLAATASDPAHAESARVLLSALDSERGS